MYEQVDPQEYGPCDDCALNGTREECEGAVLVENSGIYSWCQEGIACSESMPSKLLENPTYRGWLEKWGANLENLDAMAEAVKMGWA